jgi:threonine dehydrogenase-like Zn-dependent dehydrogenase
MRAAVFHEPRSVTVADRPDPAIREPTDAIVRVVLACVCGSDLDPANGDGGQGEGVRVPLADGTLVAVPGSGHSDETMASLLTLSDVLATGHHAAVCADVKPGGIVAVVGDGAVGLSGVLAAAHLGAGRVIALSRHPLRQQLAREFGASDIVEARGDEATEAVKELTDGVGADAVLECVGTPDAMLTAISVARPGSIVGYVGVPHRIELPIGDMFHRNVGVRGGAAPVRVYIPELLGHVLDGRINPGRVFDFETDLDGVSEAYAAMDERRAIKSLLRIGTV